MLRTQLPVGPARPRCKDITKLYLGAAFATLAGPPPDESAGADRPAGERFRYTRQVLSGDTAVLEFESTVAGT